MGTYIAVSYTHLEAGAAGIQNVENSIRYFCMEYPLDEEVCVMTYNFRNGRFCGIRKKKDPDGGDTTKMPGVLKGGSTGEDVYKRQV